jgi:hypothetical protein
VLLKIIIRSRDNRCKIPELNSGRLSELRELTQHYGLGHRVRLVAAVLKRFERQSGAVEVWILRPLFWHHRFEVMN